MLSDLEGRGRGAGCTVRPVRVGALRIEAFRCASLPLCPTAQPRAFLRLAAVTLTTGRPLSAAASSVMASALIASTEDLKRPDDDPRSATVERRLLLRPNTATRRCSSSVRSAPDRAWNRIDVIDLITKASPEPEVCAMTTASLVGLTPKIMDLVILVQHSDVHQDPRG
jgi:hypothetical protein